MLSRSIGGLPACAVVALGLGAWLHAQGISALVGAKLGVPGVSRRASAGALDTPPAPPRSADPILARNPFDSATGPLVPLPDRGPPPAPTSCPDVHILALAADADSTRSLALLRIDGAREPVLRGVGAGAGVGGEVVSIDPWGVVLERGGARCVAWIFSPAAVSTPAPGPAPQAGIAALGPGSFAVDRGTRDALLDGAGDWMKSVVVRPEKVGDDVVGLRVVTVRAGSPLESLGIRAGDVVQTVNGFPLTTPDKMLEALARLRTADRLSVTLQRAGRIVQVDYEVR
jgi:general secretion pathway protein C